MNRIVLVLVAILAYINPIEANLTQDYQTKYPHIKGYLDKYPKRVSNLSEEYLICTLPRSGTNLTMSILSQLTGRNCYWSLGELWKKGIVFNRANANTDPKLFPILGSHKPTFFSNLQKNKLIITLRDYKEHFSRSGKLEITNASIAKYFEILKLFDSWKNGEKFIVNYDDLVEDPVATIEELAAFLDAPMNRVEELLAHYEDFRYRVWQSYLVFPKGTVNQGKKSRFHQDSVPYEKLLQLENRLKEANPYLFNKYLKRYELNQDSACE